MFPMNQISMRTRWAAPKVAVLLLSVFAVASAQAKAQESRVDLNLRLGAEAMHSGKAEEAEKYFRAVIQLAPQLADGYLDLGLAQLRQGKLAEAIESLQKALQRNPEAPGASMFLGITYFQMNHLDQARAALQQEIGLNPGNAEALMWLGITELAAGNPEKAVAPLDKAAELSPKDINILDYRGRAHLLVSKNSYAQMYAVDPNSWRMHRLSAQIFSTSNQHEAAIREYRAAIRLSPKQPDLYEELGDEYRKESSLEMAAAAYAKELAMSPHNAVAMYNLGSVMVERGNAQEGIPLLKEVVTTFGKPTVADYYLGRGLADLGMYQEAADHLERATKAASQDDEVARRAYYKLSQVYGKMQRPADARNALAQFQKLEAQKAERGAQQIADWRKMNAGGAAEASVPLPPNP
jgi:tetratricopeptide (TPR) repeat protein